MKKYNGIKGIKQMKNEQQRIPNQEKPSGFGDKKLEGPNRPAE